jgi:prepilin signal peptidase PulO-like enzyme (type II secretory pathway)
MLAWSAGIFIVFFLISLLTKEKIGMGDVKLIGVISLFVEGSNIFYVLFFSLIMIFIFSIGGLLLKKVNLKTQLPFVPFLTAGVVVFLILSV